jgi:tetratricopeptide (TPR) repeat protein
VTRRLGTIWLLPALALALGCGGSPAALTAEGDRLLRANDPEGAERAYNLALARDPHHAPALYGKGWALYSSSYAELKPAARQLFQRAIDAAPSYWGGYRGKGVMLLDEGQLPAAERALRKAFELAPDEPPVLESLGLLFLDARRLDDAASLFQAAVDRAPNRGELRRFLAEVAVARGDLAEARAQIALGRESPVSGTRGLLLLDDGEVRVIVAEAEATLRNPAPTEEERTRSLRSLERADSLLGGLVALGVPSRELDARRRALARLRGRLGGPPNP